MRVDRHLIFKIIGWVDRNCFINFIFLVDNAVESTIIVEDGNATSARAKQMGAVDPDKDKVDNPKVFQLWRRNLWSLKQQYDHYSSLCLETTNPAAFRMTAADLGAFLRDFGVIDGRSEAKTEGECRITCQ